MIAEMNNYWHIEGDVIPRAGDPFCSTLVRPFNKLYRLNKIRKLNGGCHETEDFLCALAMLGAAAIPTFAGVTPLVLMRVLVLLLLLSSRPFRSCYEMADLLIRRQDV